MRLKDATDWVIAQAITGGIDLRTDGFAWTLIVDNAIEKFDVDVEQMDVALCASLSLAAPPASPLRNTVFKPTGVEIVTEPSELARYRAMRMTKPRARGD